MRLYLIENLVNGKLYVGITTRGVEERFQEHVAEARQGKRRALLNAIRKHGAENFRVTEILSAETWESLCEKEREMIAFLQTQTPSGYNVTSGGDGVVGLPEETRRLISLKNRGRKHSPEALAKIGAASKGHIVTAETRAKISAAHSGKKLTAEHRAKLSAAKTGQKQPPRSPEHSRKISEGLKKAWARRRGRL